MTNRSRAFLAGTALLTSLAMSSAVYAQETTSAVRGEVLTADGAPVANAAVSLVHQPSGTTLNTVTDGAGQFDARGLRPGGPYLITVSSDFGTAELNDVQLQVAETTRLDLTVASASTVEDIVVVGVRDVTADNTGVSSVLNRNDVQGVVSVNRDIRDLARRNILVSQNTRGDGGISIAGSNPRTNRITIDGTQAQDDFGLNTGGTPTRRGPVSLDAIEQFSVSAVPVDVENGDFQGGALDIVLRSGGNDFRGSAFVNYLNDGLVGDSIRGVEIPTAITQENYGGFLSGPIWRDKLFFALSYETYETADQTATGPEGAGFPNAIRGISAANLAAFRTLFDNTYAADFNVGDITRTKPITDEKYTAKLDWNITDNQRLSLTYRHAESSLIQRTNLSTSSAGFDSQWYLTGEDDTAYAAELNSQWTDAFSTQLRVTYREYERLQDPPSGQEFADVQVCSGATSINLGGDNLFSCGTLSNYRFGPDQFRHANFLATENLQIQAKGEYSLGDHLFKFGFQSQEVTVFNIFVPNSDGTYYFDSLADFQAGRANRLVYSNAITGNANDAAAAFEYTGYTVFAQDTLQLFDNLSVQAGVRFDWYKSDDRPAFNQNFFNRVGFTNRTTYDGSSLIMPRASFEWEANDWLTIQGGLGLFQGGLPDVVLSNAFSTTGVLTSGIQIERNADGTFRETTGVAGFTQAIGASALNLNLTDPRTFYDLPAAVQALQGGAVAAPTSEVNALIPGFELPSDWKYFLTTTVELPEGWASWAGEYGSRALDNWRVNFDVVYTEVNKGISFRDFRAQPLTVRGVQQFTPDGRLRYDGILGTAAQRASFGITSTNPGTNRDIVAFNTDEGESWTVGVSAERAFFDDELNLLVGYAASNIEDRVSGARFASTASSLYGTGPSGFDPNEEAYGTSFEEISNRWKAEVNYSHAFFGDLITRLNLFAEIRDGRPISFTMSDTAASRSPTFGVNRGGQLLYVPDFAGDPNPNDLVVGPVVFDTTATRDRFRALVDTFGLEYGRTVGKGEGSDDQPETYQIDLQFSQELPAFWLPGRFRFTADIQNLANLLNDEWGIVEEYGDTLTLINAQCADGNGVVQSGVGNPICSTYRYTNASTTADIKNRDNNGKSFWAIQLGLRYEF